jgi:hypothetical protein
MQAICAFDAASLPNLVKSVCVAGWQQSGRHSSSAPGGGRQANGRSRSSATADAQVVQDMRLTVLPLPAAEGRCEQPESEEKHAAAQQSGEAAIGSTSTEQRLRAREAGRSDAGPDNSLAPQALMLAVSRRGGQVDLVAWSLGRHAAWSSTQKTGQPAAAADTASTSGCSPVADDAANTPIPAIDTPEERTASTDLSAGPLCAPPAWLQALPLPPAAPGVQVSKLERTNLWVPLCWLPNNASAGATLVCGSYAGRFAAWHVQATAALRGKLCSTSAVDSSEHGTAVATQAAANPSQREQARSNSGTSGGGRGGGTWQRASQPPSRAQTASSWRAPEATLLITPCAVEWPCMHTRMLFSIDVCQQAGTTGSDASAASGGVELWTTSLDRAVVAWRIDGAQPALDATADGAPPHRHAPAALVLHSHGVWHGVGAELMSLHVQPSGAPTDDQDVTFYYGMRDASLMCQIVRPPIGRLQPPPLVAVCIDSNSQNASLTATCTALASITPGLLLVGCEDGSLSYLLLIAGKVDMLQRIGTAAAAAAAAGSVKHIHVLSIPSTALSVGHGVALLTLHQGGNLLLWRSPADESQRNYVRAHCS